ncbi:MULTISPECIES: ATP-binding cassette domain-containing protein [Rhodomicrobium]|uniref:ATP-binding cassette domain-containing protein n=1 Tax=Rhodomicrobium TaxID=1068 RepID=UPI000B4C0253|nr:MULTISPECIES: ATP-binding cassette domain-containing protein [Rhodomicrobium]
MALPAVIPLRPNGSEDKPAPGAGEALVTGDRLGLTLSGKTILENVDVTVHAGEILTVIGPNGAGKTSLARLLLGLMPPTTGSIARAPGLKVGYVPQRFPVDPSIPINVRRFLTLTVRVSPSAIRSVLQEVGALHLIDRPISVLSGGEFQRVCLARALIGVPRLLVLDEPAQALDYAGELQLYELIGDIRRRRGCGILLISHDLHVVLGASDRVLCINGHVCCEGVPEKVANHPEYARLFGRDAGKAVAVYRHRHDHEHDLSGAVKCGEDCGHKHD